MNEWRIKSKLLQEKQLKTLLKAASQTQFGKRHHVDSIQSYEMFQDKIPIQSYESLQPYIEEMKRGATDILWPGKTTYFAVSSGTTGVGKHLPVSQERLNSDRKFRRRIVKTIVKNAELWSVFAGKMLSMPGKVERINNSNHSYTIGEISGITASMTPKWLDWFQVLSVRESCKLDWNERFQLLIDNAIQQDVRSIAGAPTWITELISRVQKRTGISITKVWPNLKLIISGGVALQHYLPQFENWFSKKMNYLEMYGASEGYVGLSEVNEPGLFLLERKQGLFYEFEWLNENKIIPLWEIEPEKEYALRITNNSGLWRFATKDKVQLRKDGKLRITGRVGAMSDYFGEALFAHEVESVLKNMKVTFSTITIGPMQKYSKNRIGVVLTNSNTQWDNDLLFKADELLSQINRHYQIRRQTNTLHPICIKNGSIEEATRKFLQLSEKAQGKIPVILTQLNAIASFFDEDWNDW